MHKKAITISGYVISKVMKNFLKKNFRVETF